MKYIYFIIFIFCFCTPFSSVGAAEADCNDAPKAATPISLRTRFKLPMYSIALERHLRSEASTKAYPFKPEGDHLQTFDFNIKRVGDDGHEQTVGVLYVHYIPHPDRQYYKVEGPIAYCKDGDW